MPYTKERARHAALVRHGSPPEVIADALRDVRAARADDYVRNLVDQAPPLTVEQRARLAAILLGAA